MWRKEHAATAAAVLEVIGVPCAHDVIVTLPCSPKPAQEDRSAPLELYACLEIKRLESAWEASKSQYVFDGLYCHSSLFHVLPVPRPPFAHPVVPTHGICSSSPTGVTRQLGEGEQAWTKIIPKMAANPVAKRTGMRIS